MVSMWFSYLPHGMYSKTVSLKQQIKKYRNKGY